MRRVRKDSLLGPISSVLPSDKTKEPDRHLTIGLPKNGGDLLSQLVGQYHRRG